MSLMNVFNVAGSAISAQSQRLNVVASNLANADAVAGPDGNAYKARQVVFTSAPTGQPGTAGVRVSNIVEDSTPGKRVHDLCHPRQCQRRRGDGEHDLGLPLLSEQRRDDEHRAPDGAKDLAVGPVKALACLNACRNESLKEC